MAMTVGELQNELAKLSPDLTVMIGMNRNLSQILRVTSNPKSNLIVLGGKDMARTKKDPFTTDEDGIIGHLVRLGLENEEIEVILGRPANSVKKRRAVLGF